MLAALALTALLRTGHELYFSLPYADAMVSPGERQGLVNIYLATAGEGWTGITQGWHSHVNASEDPCTPAWTGVTCNGSTSIMCVFFYK
jgi:hypothetical protein